MVRFAELMSAGRAGAAPDSVAAGQAGWQAARALDIRGVTADSRAVRPGDLFAALPGGHHDGRRFIADAVARGAVAVLAPS